MGLKHKEAHWFHSKTERKIQAIRVLTFVAHIPRIKVIQENSHSFCTRMTCQFMKNLSVVKTEMSSVNISLTKLQDF